MKNDFVECTTIKPFEILYHGMMKNLHDVFKYDFNHDYKFYYHKGKFTMRDIEKLLNDGFDKYNSLVAVMTRPVKRIYDLYSVDTDEFITVLYTPISSGNYDVEFDNRNKLRKPLDWIYRKTDFNTLRKSDDIETLVLIQKNKDLTSAKKNNDIDYKSRFKAVPHYDGMNLDDAMTYSFDFIPYGYKTPFKDRFMSMHIKDFIDKSGYLKALFTDDLEKRAKQIKEKALKDAYLKTDNTDKIDTLERLIEQYKTKLSEQLKAIKTLDDLNKVDRLLGWSGLYDIISDYNTFKRKTENKDFDSIEQSNNLYDHINKRIYEYI